MALLALYFLVAVLALPFTFVAMLFAGNIGLDWSYLTIYPGAVALLAYRATASVSVNK